MPVFVLFVFGAVILGAGAMLAPAWPTTQPRIGLAAALALALVTGGTIFYSSLFGWDTLVIDYLMFALVTGIFLGGTLSVGQTRAEARGETLLDSEQGWPGPQDLGFFVVIAIAAGVIVLILPTPLGHEAQGYGMMAVATRQGGTFDTLAPVLSDVTYLYPPGFSALTAYLSQQLNQSVHTTQFAVGGILALLNIWLVYDLGAELRDKRLGRAMALAAFLSLGLVGLLANGQYPALMGTAFLIGFWIFAIRVMRHGYPADVVGAGLMMGATAIAHTGSFILLQLGFLPWIASVWLARPTPDRRNWLLLSLGVPFVAFLSVLPWLVDVWPLLSEGFQSPFERDVNNVLVMVNNHGFWVVPLALFGLCLGWQERDRMTIMAAGWLLLILDFSTTGGIASLFPFVTRYLNPYDVAWQGPILAYAILGGMALLWLWDYIIMPRFENGMRYRHTYFVNGVLVAVLLLVAAFSAPLRGIATSLLDQPDSYASSSDVEALEWIRENTASDRRILNFPGPYEGDWAYAISEREAVYYPTLPYADYTDADLEHQRNLMAFWRDPGDPGNLGLLQDAGITLVVVPEIVVDRDTLDSMWRWDDEPLAWNLDMRSRVADADYLELIYGDPGSGAQVYLVDGASLVDPPSEDYDSDDEG